MRMLRDSSASQFISTIAVVQTVVVVMCFLGLGIVMKFHGYPEAPFGTRWNGLALFLRNHPGVLLLIPLFWTAVAIVLERRMEDDARGVSAILAALLMFLLTILTIKAMMDPYTREILFKL